MARKIIISEESARKIAEYEMLNEVKSDDILNSREFKDAIKSAIKKDRDIARVTEKQVKEIVTDCMNELFKSLWQKNNFWSSAIRNS